MGGRRPGGCDCRREADRACPTPPCRRSCHLAHCVASPEAARPRARTVTAVVRAAGGVVLRDGPEGREVLLIHRRRYGDWTLPKGKCDPGEHDEDCALREVEEETGLVCELLHELSGDGRTSTARGVRSGCATGPCAQSAVSCDRHRQRSTRFAGFRLAMRRACSRTRMTQHFSIPTRPPSETDTPGGTVGSDRGV